MSVRVVASLFTLIRLEALVHDTVLPHHVPKDCECAPWSTNSSSLAMWEDATLRIRAGSSCSLPAYAVMPDDPSLSKYAPSDGWCYCNKESKLWYTWCDPPAAFPSQINLLVVDATHVMVNFVTADDGQRSNASVVAELRYADDHDAHATFVDGFSTLYSDSTSHRHLSYHHVMLAGLKERTQYEYRVRVNASKRSVASEWSDWLSFRSLYSSGPTRLALYGDMGVFASIEAKPSVPALSRHNIGNLIDDLRAEQIDFVVHSGDLAYEYEVNGGARGDGFMDSYSKLLAHAPWAPGWGNHEYLELDRGNRLGNITAGLLRNKVSTNPGSSRMWYSIDVGLLHLLQLDLSPYFCHFNGCSHVDTCGFPDEWTRKGPSGDEYDFEAYRENLLAFVRRDLASVDRHRTPWLIVTAHYPLYETYDSNATITSTTEHHHPDFGARGHCGNDAGLHGAQPCKEQAIADIEPLLLEFAVDVYFAGHNHNYESTWPLAYGSRVQENFTDPRAPIHICSGAAGPPEFDGFGRAANWSREPRLVMTSYSRVSLLNATTMIFEQVANDNKTVVDSFIVHQRRSNRSEPFLQTRMIIENDFSADTII